MPSDQRREEILQQVDSLPPMPHVALRVMELLDDPNFRMPQLVQLISRDASLLTEILRLANSPMYYCTAEISSINQAVTFLGVNAVKNLIISLSTKSLFASGEVTDIDRAVWEHSLATAILSRLTALRTKPNLAEEAFIVGLMHDIGCVVMSKQLEKFPEVVKKSIDHQSPLLMIERDEFGFDHRELGAFMLDSWKMPEHFSSIIMNLTSPENSSHKESTLIISFANLATQKLGFGLTGNSVDIELEAICKTLELEEADVAELLEMFQDIHKAERELFRIG